MENVVNPKTFIMYLDPKWSDTRDGNILPNSWSISSENPTTFNVVYHFLWDMLYVLKPIQKRMLGALLENKYLTNEGEFRTNEYDHKDSGFSLDESVSVAAASYKYGFYEPLSHLKVFTKQTWFRIYDIIPFLVYCKYRWTHYLWILQLAAAIFVPWYLWVLCIPLQVFVGLSMFSSSLKEPGKTSGKQLNFVQVVGLIDKHWWVKLIWKIILLFVNYTQAFSVYYPESDHPDNVMARQLWEYTPTEEKK